jgi:Flp pilus assembly protein TadD
LEEALKQFQDAIILTPEYLMAHYHIGVIRERQGEMEAAERAFEHSEDQAVGEVSSLFHLAVIRRAQGDNAAAEECLRRAREFGQSQKAAASQK